MKRQSILTKQAKVQITGVIVEDENGDTAAATVGIDWAVLTDEDRQTLTRLIDEELDRQDQSE